MKIVIPTCDKYSHFVPGNIHCIRKYWKDCPYDIVVLTGKKLIPVSTAEIVYLGEDMQYGTNLLRFLKNHYNDKEILIWLDDYYLTNVDRSIVSAAHELTSMGKVDGVRLSKLYTPQEETVYEKDKRFVFINKIEQYSFSQQATIWNTYAFTRLLCDGEDPWETELNGSGRIKHGAVSVGDIIGVTVEALSYRNMCHLRTLDHDSVIWYMESVAETLNV